MLADEELLSSAFHPTVEILQLLHKLDFSLQLDCNNPNSKYLVKTELEVSSQEESEPVCSQDSPR